MKETRVEDVEIDGREPRMLEHLCAKDLTVKDGPVEDCCIDEWRDHHCEPR